MRKWIKYPLIIFISCIALFLPKQSLVAQDRFLKYFPSNTTIDYEREIYSSPIAAKPNECQTINEFQQGYNDCTQCMDLKDDCPDCCLLDTDSDQNFDAIDCTEAADEDYSCDSFAFSGDSCPKAECFALDNPDCSNNNPPGCQVKGCPDDDYKPEYDSGKDEACTEESGVWYCAEDNLIPTNRGCVPDSETTIDNYDQDFHQDPETELFYQTNPGGRPPEIEDGDPDFDSDIADSLGGESITSYYKYEPLASYSSYISSCISYSNEAESCQKQVKCCQDEVCPSEPKPGYGNCTDGCGKRLDFDKEVEVPDEGIKNCSELQHSDCSLIQESITNCLLGSCASCFKKIDSNFSHDFVAKSGESLTIFWNISSKPVVTPAAGYTEVQARDAIDTYFYTIVKVVDASGDAVYSSIMHQKSFNNAFSTFNATHIDSTDLKIGEEYSIEIYYYLPDIVDDIAEVKGMEMDIAGMEMTLIKIRE